MMGTGRIIFLHGASSSGKSTIARAIRERIEAPFWHISIDHLRDAGVLPSARIAKGDFAWRDLRGGFFTGFHRSLAAYASAGNDLIVEHILDTQGWLDELVGLLAPFDVFFVGVHCALPVLEAREAARGDRPPGSAARDHATIHRGLEYDFVVRSEDGAEANAEAVIASWRARRAPSVFARLAEVNAE